MSEVIKILLVAALVGMTNCQLFGQDLTKYVDPMIGTGGHGHTFPGPTLPFGLVQISPDARLGGWDWCSGYNYIDTTMMGFSHTHLSGTGVSDLGDVLIVPTTGVIQFNPGKEDKPKEGYRSAFSHDDEKASIGYYSVLLKDHNIKAEVTCSQRVGMHRYTFPKSDSSNIIIDIGSTIFDGNRSHVVDSRMEFIDDQTVSGYKIVRGWAPFRKLYYVIKFSKPFQEHGLSKKGENFAAGGPLIGRVTFRTEPGERIMLKVGISTVSAENAQENIKEISDWNFERVVQSAKDIWNKELGKIKVEGTEQQKIIFYTAMYHALIGPNNIADANGQYMGPDYNIHTSTTGNYYSTFSLWDTYRAANPLYTIIQKDRAGDFVSNMLDHFDNYGYLPIWTLMGTENHCMIGNHAVPVIVDAYLKGIKGFDAQRAYKAIKSSLTEDHKESDWKYWDYDARGYLAYDYGHASISKTLEFSFDDWCAAEMARKLGYEEDYRYFAKRAGFYKNIFNKKHNLSWPKDSTDNWMADFSPTVINSKNQLTEANSWQNTWSVQHDVKGLIQLFPSKEKFIEKLDSTFNEKNKPGSTFVDVSGLIGQYAHGNEPSHHVAYLYNYASQPWKTQFLVNKILIQQYSNKPDGIAGNEDCGQMSAWFILNAMGFYPVNPANGYYDIGSPLLSRAEIDSGDGKKFIITTRGLSPKAVYIQSMKLNGKPYNKLYITHQDIVNGGTLHFEMGKKPNKNWATTASALAPSMTL